MNTKNKGFGMAVPKALKQSTAKSALTNIKHSLAMKNTNGQALHSIVALESAESLAQIGTQAFLSTFKESETLIVAIKKLEGQPTQTRHMLWSVCAADKLKRYNLEGYNIYFQPNVGHGMDKNSYPCRANKYVTSVTAVFVELDAPGTQEQQDKLRAFKKTCPPSIEVESSPGKFHIYWFVQDFPLEAFTLIQEAFIDHFNSDKAVKDLSRLLRVPGYINQKYSNRAVITQIKSCNPERKYTASQIQESLEKIGCWKTQDIESQPLTATNIAKQAGRYLSLQAFVSKKLKPLLEGKVSENIDRSNELTKLAYELWGWSNLMAERGIATDNPETIFYETCQKIEFDRADRVLQSISSLETAIPSLQKAKGKPSCIDRIENSLKRQEPKQGTTRLNGIELTEFYKTEFPDVCYDVWRKQVITGNERLDNENSDISLLYAYLATKHGILTSKEKAVDYLTNLALETPYDPVLEYLEECKANKNKLTNDEWNSLDKYLLGRADSDNLDTKMIQKWAIAAVARVYQPGCKVDEMLVLVGRQGLRKSAFFSALGGEFYCDSLGPLDNMKDDYITLHSSWIHEWGELDRVTGYKEAGKVKAFVTKAEDSFRPPYARKNQRFKRRSIIGATVNGDEFLRDTTGNRRFAIVKISTPIDIQKIKAIRNKFWAKAVEEYEKGTQWWYEGEDFKLLNERADKYTDSDVWEEAISGYLVGASTITISSILTNVLNMDIDKQDQKAKIRVSKVLTALGWEKGSRRMIQGKRAVIWQKSTPEIPKEVSGELIDWLGRISKASEWEAYDERLKEIVSEKLNQYTPTELGEIIFQKLPSDEQSRLKQTQAAGIFD